MKQAEDLNGRIKQKNAQNDRYYKKAVSAYSRPFLFLMSYIPKLLPSQIAIGAEEVGVVGDEQG